MFVHRRKTDILDMMDKVSLKDFWFGERLRSCVSNRETPTVVRVFTKKRRLRKVVTNM